MNSEDEIKSTGKNSYKLEDLAEVLGALANISRLQIVSFLKNKPGEFSELKEETKLSKTALAHHLEKLVKYGILKKTARGKYTLTEDGSDLFVTIVGAYESSKRRIATENRKRADHLQTFYSKSSTVADQLAVHFERLLPMRVASFQVTGPEPETKAWNKLREWAEPRGLFADSDKHPIYGFNNPEPVKGKSEYGYEFWLQVEDDFESDEVKIIDIPEAFYVVTRCLVNDPHKDIPDTWKKLIKWIKDRNYKFGDRCGLEKVISSSDTGKFILDIYIPLIEESVTKK
ncbi:MAG: GyrI-like domain-containing protein [Candidatus Heimdallarchaeota archaeon]